MSIGTNDTIELKEPRFSKILFSDTRLALLWLIVRVYGGWQWIQAGWEKVQSPLWVGPQAGVVVKGFIMGALQKTAGAHADVSPWYASFLRYFALPHTAVFSHIVAYGELLVGIGLVLGVFTGIAAFFGIFMNLNYLFAGTVSVNPLLLVLQLFLILAWRVAGWYGLDRWVLPALGTPWQPGKGFTKSK